MSLRLGRPALTFWTIALGVLALDQITKWLVRTRIEPGSLHPVLGEFLQLTYVRNTGAAFGMFAGKRVIFIFTTLMVLAFIAAYWRRSRPKAWPIVVALGLVTSGAVGNLIDRASVGRVTDFLYVKFIDFPVFNVADSAISVGVVILMAWLLFGPEDHAGGESPADDSVASNDTCASNATSASLDNDIKEEVER